MQLRSEAVRGLATSSSTLGLSALQLGSALTATPVFTLYQGESAESIRFVMTGGPERVAAVPGALLLN